MATAMTTATATAVAHTVQRLEEEGRATAHQLPTVDDGNPAHQQHNSTSNGGNSNSSSEERQQQQQ